MLQQTKAKLDEICDIIWDGIAEELKIMNKEVRTMGKQETNPRGKVSREDMNLEKVTPEDMELEDATGKVKYEDLEVEDGRN